jgi:hypothetical protein
MTRRASRRTRRKRKRIIPSRRIRRVVHMWSLGIVMLPQVMMMIVVMTRSQKRRFLQALPFKRSLLSLTLHHASWLRPLRYKLMMMDMMRNMVMKVKVKVTMMINPLKIN